MTAKTIKTLGELRQWHLERFKNNDALANTWGRDRKYGARMRREGQKHKRFAKAIEQCLPRPF
jgi:hypothetical protein